jgi:hypothetical protein
LNEEVVVHPREPLGVAQLGDDRIVRGRTLDHERQQRELACLLAVVIGKRALLENRPRGA